MKLHKYIAAQFGRKFRYGTHDCVTFAGRWAEARAGREIVPAYASLREGLDVLGARPMLEVLRAEFLEVPKLQAQIGDVAVMASESELPALGIVAGATVVCFTKSRVLGHVPLTEALHVFRVV